MCNRNNLPISQEVDDILEGWVGKAKGAIQILYERGWIDPSNINKYTMSGRKDEFLHIDLTYSLIDIISKQPDFLHEQTLLQYHCALLGVKVVRSPKCHCEIAGEGIEYAWGAAKIWFRMQPLSQRANRESFLKLVGTSLSNDVLAIKRV